ncbi:hypothetical protein AN944_02303 [Shewanella sp. P1-14-1]|uniref:hypothetical protein n=1 Tax=Shewanella sp. P1-14-1 TaxID=1723761 RepID=UPI0006D67F80|nr:hypothetical protein [Shewanella sp. P1-14-1]KPZ70231.1 hypothetical protein AN944_02303 [Shewanella sp. P1-14-1]
MSIEKLEIVIKRKKRSLIQALSDEELLEVNTLVSSEYKRRFSKCYYRYQVSPTKVQWLVEPYIGKVKNKSFHSFLVRQSKSKRAADKNKLQAVYKSNLKFDAKKLLSSEELESEYHEAQQKSQSLNVIDSSIKYEKQNLEILPLVS